MPRGPGGVAWGGAGRHPPAAGLPVRVPRLDKDGFGGEAVVEGLVEEAAADGGAHHGGADGVALVNGRHCRRGERSMEDIL